MAKELKSHGDISVGDTVIVTFESGFQGGVPQERMVKRILDCPPIGIFPRTIMYEFMNGEIAGQYDHVRKKGD